MYENIESTNFLNYKNIKGSFLFYLLKCELVSNDKLNV